MTGSKTPLTVGLPLISAVAESKVNPGGSPMMQQQMNQ
jgi:hypothetical protein